MLRKLKQTQIIVDNVYGFEIQGIIKKINIKTKQDLSNVRVQIETEDNEILFNDNVFNGAIIYPKNVKDDVKLFFKISL